MSAAPARATTTAYRYQPNSYLEWGAGWYEPAGGTCHLAAPMSSAAGGRADAVFTDGVIDSLLVWFLCLDSKTEDAKG